MKFKFTNSAWSILEYLWNPLLIFAATPFFLKTLGADKYGLWMLLLTAVNFGSFLNAGTGAAAIKHISAELGGNNFQRIEATLRSAFALALIGGGFLGTTIFGIFWFAGGTLFPRMGDPLLVHLTGVAAAALAWVEQVDNVFASALKDAEQYGLAARIEIVSKTLQVIACIFVLLTGGTLQSVYWALIATSLIRMASKIFIAQRALSVHSVWPQLKNVSSILHFSTWGWLQGIGGMFFNVSDRFFVGSLLGAASLAHYSIATQLASQIHGLASAGISVVFPMVSRKRASNSAFSLRRIASLVFSANLLLSTMLALGLFFFGKDILALWIGNEKAAAIAPLLRYLTIAYFLLALNITPYYILLGLGRVKSVALWVVLGGCVGLAPMLYGTMTKGLSGAGAGKLAYALATLTLFFPLIRLLLRNPQTIVVEQAKQ